MWAAKGQCSVGYCLGLPLPTCSCWLTTATIRKRRGICGYTFLSFRVMTWKSHHFSLCPTGQNFITSSHSAAREAVYAMCLAKMKGFCYWRGDSRYWKTVCHNDSLWPDSTLPSQPHSSRPLFMFYLLESRWATFYSEAFRSLDFSSLYLCSPSAMPLRYLFFCLCFVKLIFPSKSISPAFTYKWLFLLFSSQHPSSVLFQWHTECYLPYLSTASVS